MKLIHATIITPRIGNDGPHLKCDEAELAILNYASELYVENTELRGKLDGLKNVTAAHVRYAEWCFWAFVVTGSCLVGSWGWYFVGMLIERRGR